MFYSHRWAVPPRRVAAAIEKAQREVGILFYSAMFLAKDQEFSILLTARRRR